MAFGELGKHSIFKNIEMRMLLFWIRIVTSKTSKLSHIVYDIMKSLFDLDIYRSPWIVKIKNSIDKLGLSYLWDTIGSKDAKWLELIIKQRLDDVYSQNWHYEVNHNSHCLNYRIFKQTCTFEKCLIKLPFKYRVILCKFRCGNHRLPIVSGRYSNVDRSQRFCNLCNNSKLGDEFHYLFECTEFEQARTKLLDNYFKKRPDSIKMYKLFNSPLPSTLLKLSKFCSIIMDIFK